MKPLLKQPFLSKVWMISLIVNEVYGEYFSEHKPARSCVEVARLPKDALVEIEVIALVK